MQPMEFEMKSARRNRAVRSLEIKSVHPILEGLPCRAEILQEIHDLEIPR